jgi:predicted ABC-type ATPase
LATLFIIGGPNGAGKSTNSEYILRKHQIKAFDYDKELDHAWRPFGFDPAVEDGVRNSVGELFLEKKNLAIQNKTNFAFETNYHHESVPQTAKHFQEAGHETVLLFIALPSEEAAIDRVKLRVSQGGHSVDEKTIRERYNKGLELLDQTFQQYDRIDVFISKENKQETILWVEPQLKAGTVFDKELMNKLPRLSAFMKSLD